MSDPIYFKGEKYSSVEEMPPEVRSAYDYVQIDADFRAALEPLKAMSGGGTPHPWDTGSSGVSVPAGYDSVSNLGPAEQVFLINRDVGGAFVGLIFGGLLMISGLVAFGAMIISIIQHHFEVWGLIVGLTFVGLGGFLLYAGFLTLWSQWMGIQSAVTYRDGFAYQQGGTAHVWPYQEIAAIFSDEVFHSSRRRGYTSRSYTLIKKSGEKITLLGDQLQGTTTLIGTIKRRVVALLDQPLQQAYAEGQPVTFGPVTVSKQGIQAGSKQFAWGDVLNVEVKSGNLIVNLRQGGSHKIRAKAIPNIESLCQLIGVNPWAIGLSYIGGLN